MGWKTSKARYFGQSKSEMCVEFYFATKYHIFNKFEAEFSSILNPFWTVIILD